VFPQVPPPPSPTKQKKWKKILCNLFTNAQNRNKSCLKILYSETCKYLLIPLFCNCQFAADVCPVTILKRITAQCSQHAPVPPLSPLLFFFSEHVWNTITWHQWVPFRKTNLHNMSLKSSHSGDSSMGTSAGH
jgi:hypothetical protein